MSPSQKIRSELAAIRPAKRPTARASLRAQLKASIIAPKGKDAYGRPYARETNPFSWN